MDKLPNFNLINVTELKEYLNSYLDKLKDLEEVYITVRGKVVAKLVYVKQKGKINEKKD